MCSCGWRGLALALTLCALSDHRMCSGYDNGVVNGVFEMPSFREHMGWPPTVMNCETMECTVGTHFPTFCPIP